MRFLRLFLVFTRLGALSDLAYRANFWFQVFESLLNLGAALALVALVFSQTDQVAGWRLEEMAALLGVYFLVLGVLSMVIAPSLTRFMEDVQLGNLDLMLTKPADAQLLVSIQEVRIWKVVDVVLGLGLLGFSLARLGTQVGAAEAGGFGLALLAGAAIVYSLWLVLTTLCFWFIRIENIVMIFWSLYWAARWPVGMYPGWLRWTLTLVVPVAFAVTVPAEALSGRLGPATLVGALALAVFALAFSRWFWRVGLRHYSGASA